MSKSRPVYVFDAYGTLFDVHSAVAAHAAAAGPDAAAFSDAWRRKQLEYSWVRALTGRFRAFEALTEDALDTAFRLYPSVDWALRGPLLEAYRALALYPDAKEVLARLRAGGAATAILSNGSRYMLDAACAEAGIGDMLDAVLSSEALHTYKTEPAVYGLVLDRFDAGAGDITFVSSNRWDVAGAAAFGFNTVWVNRDGAPDEYEDMPAARVVSGLKDIAG